MESIKNLDKINPAKRNIVASILSKVNGNQFLDKIIIFGSAVREDCKDTSDLDIAIKWSEDCFDEDYVFKDFTLPVFEIISMETKGENDVIPIGYEGEAMREAIKQGVVVYENNHV